MSKEDAGASEMSIAGLRAVPAGREVTLRARVLGAWEVEGAKMCLVGDETGLVRVALGKETVEDGCTYVFSRVAVRLYTGGWRSLQTTAYTKVIPSGAQVDPVADQAYIDRVYRILRGLEKKRQRLGAPLN